MKPNLAQTAIRSYQFLAKLKVQILITVFGYASVCRHQPSCSEYTIAQIQKHGTILGFSKGFIRLLQCWSL